MKAVTDRPAVVVPIHARGSEQVSASAVHVEDLVSVLNPVRASDLSAILRLCPARVRPEVAMAFAELDRQHWCHLAGLEPVSLMRWLRGESRLPYGAALRLAHVLGVSAEQLFQGWAD